MDNQITKTEKELKVIDLLESNIELYKNAEKQNVVLNTPPPQKWIAKHPYIKKEITTESGQRIKVPYDYLPIDKVEYLLKKIFKFYRIEILREGTSFNGVYVVVRVHYLNPSDGQWSFHDGIGSMQLQTAKGTSPADLANINNGALSMAFPAAKTVAIKDACDHLGDIFGANLNREQSLIYKADTETLNHGEYLD